MSAFDTVMPVYHNDYLTELRRTVDVPEDEELSGVQYAVLNYGHTLHEGASEYECKEMPVNERDCPKQFVETLVQAGISKIYVTDRNQWWIEGLQGLLDAGCVVDGFSKISHFYGLYNCHNNDSVSAMCLRLPVPWETEDSDTYTNPTLFYLSQTTIIDDFNAHSGKALAIAAYEYTQAVGGQDLVVPTLSDEAMQEFLDVLISANVQIMIVTDNSEGSMLRVQRLIDSGCKAFGIETITDKQTQDLIQGVRLQLPESNK